MSGIIEWISEPEAYNWITLVGALAAVATSIFTGYAAFASWSDRRQRMPAEWTHKHFPHLIFSFHLTNHTQDVLVGESVKVKGPLDTVVPWRQGKLHDKHASWPPSEASVDALTVMPGAHDTVSFAILVDPKRLQEAASSPLPAARSWIGKLLWRVFKWRISAGASLRIRLIVRRRSAPMRPIRFTHTIRIYAEQAELMAANMEKTAGQ